MKFSKSLIAVSALTFLASCGNNSAQTPTVETTTTTTTKETSTTEATPTTPTTSTTTTTTTTQNTEKEYKGNITYKTPAGDTTAAFELEMAADGTITDAGADLVSMAEGDMGSKMNIEKFDDAIDNLIVGKKLADIQALDAVAGASLTTDAFKKFAGNIQ